VCPLVPAGVEFKRPGERDVERTSFARAERLPGEQLSRVASVIEIFANRPSANCG